MMKRTFAYLLCGALCLMHKPCQAVSGCFPVDPKQSWTDIDHAYLNHLLDDTTYFDEIDAIAPQYWMDKSFDSLLSRYEDLAFKNPAYGKYRIRYYHNLIIHAARMHQYGRAIYYAGKYDEEEKLAGIDLGGGLGNYTDNEGLTFGAVAAVVIEGSNGDYEKIQDWYKHTKPVFTRMIRDMPEGNVSPVKVHIALTTICDALNAGDKGDDTTMMQDQILTLDSIDAEAMTHRALYAKDSQYYKLTWLLGHFIVEDQHHHNGQAAHYLQASIKNITDPSYPRFEKAEDEIGIYGRAFDFYFDHGKMDSARLYWNLARQIPDTALSNIDDKANLLQRGEVELLSADKSYKDAYEACWKLYKARDSAYGAVCRDKDNNLYALAEKEDTEKKLVKTENQRKAAELFSTLSGISTLAVILGSIIAFLFIRSQQQKRLMGLQTRIARNFHDDIGPMMLYANSIIKSEIEEHYSRGLVELQTQLVLIGETSRNIAHELLGLEPANISVLLEEIGSMLQKLHQTMEVTYDLELKMEDLLLSRSQHIHLKKIITELVTNTIKYAEKSGIHIVVDKVNEQMHFTYADEGKGLPHLVGDPMEFGRSMSTSGVGLRNIRDRVRLMKGEARLHNHYPNGYYIELFIPIAKNPAES
jgi:signal transduction histidine kinase